MQTSPKIQLANRKAHAFTLVDLMVSVAVIALLVGLLTPAVSAARNAALRSACAANVRQQGLACQMFAYDRGGKLPTSVFSARSTTSFGYAPSETVHLRVDKSNAVQSSTNPHAIGATKLKEQWDGLGWLYKHEYVEAPEVFYCPKATSAHTLERYRSNFGGEPGPIVGNYQLRLADPNKYFSDLDPTMALIANSMRSLDEYSHKSGNNMLLADMSVQWFADGMRLMAYLHPLGVRADDRGGENPIERAWEFLDTRQVPVFDDSDGGSRHNGGNETTDTIDKSKKSGTGG